MRRGSDMKLKFIAVFACALVLMALPMLVFAAGGDVIRVVPVGEPDTGMAIITSDEPATLEIHVTNAQKSPVNEVWLLFVIDEDTYNGLTNIIIDDTDGPTTVLKADFTGGPVSSGQRPLEDDTNDLPNGEYPGCTSQTQWSVPAIRDQMSQVHPKPSSVRYVLVYGFASIDTSPKAFTVTVVSSHVNVLVLAQGRVEGEADDPLNSNSPFSGSTLIIPELGTVLLALASFSAFALYSFKRRKL